MSTSSPTEINCSPSPPSERFAYYGQHVLAGQQLFTVIGGHIDSFPNVPSPEHIPHSPTDIECVQELNWISNEHPFMALVPVAPFVGPLFSRMKGFYYDNIPLEYIKEDKVWCLKISLLIEWSTLERNMRKVLAAMRQYTLLPFPPFLAFWAYPKQYGYEEQYRSKHAARIMALRSRAAFVPLMAALTLMIRLLDDCCTHLPKRDLLWRSEIVEKAEVSHQWFTELELSLRPYSARRVGGFIDLTRCHFLSWLPNMWTGCQHFILHWGDIGHLRTSCAVTPAGSSCSVYVSPFLRHKVPVPSFDDISHLEAIATSRPVAMHEKPSPLPNFRPTNPSSFSLQRRRRLQEVTIINVPDVPSLLNSRTNQNLPAVEKYSGQLEGEDWQSFFARRQKANAKIEQAETVQERQRRTQRLRHAEKQQVPCKSGARVFIWEDVNGFLVRRAAGRNYYESYWDEYGPSQRAYDSFADEWDLCHAFDPACDPEDFNSEWDATEAPLVFLDPDDDADLDTGGQFSSSADLSRMHGSESIDVQAIDLSSNTISDTAYYRFGWIDPMAITSAEPTLSWFKLSQILGSSNSYHVAQATVPSESEKKSIGAFFGHFQTAHSLKDIPPDLYDLRQENSDIVSQRYNSIRIRIELIEGRKCYFLTPPAIQYSDAPFEIMMTSAANIAEILRTCADQDLSSMVKSLLYHGVSFRTCVRAIYRSIPPPRYQFWEAGLGYRPPGYKATPMDYYAYQDLRDTFFRSPRGRAALLRGGLICRLAFSVVEAEVACHGPSDFVFEEGICLRSSDDTSIGYWDDELTLHEIDLICGVYRVDSGVPDQRHGGRQTSDISWWPKPTAWENSGLNVGYWSRDCENWYLHRLDAIKRGDAQPKSPKEWRHVLRFSPEPNRMNHQNNRLAAEFLDKILQPMLM